MAITPWNACIQDPNWWMRQIECHPAFAGYVQALGSIGAIIVAFYASQISLWWERRNFAAAIAADTQRLIESLREPAMEVRRRADTIKGQLGFFRNQAPGDDIWDDWFQTTILLKPPIEFEFFDRRLDGIDLSKIGRCREIAESIFHYNTRRSLTAGISVLAPGYWPKMWNDLDQAIDRVRAAVDEASAAHWS